MLTTQIRLLERQLQEIEQMIPGATPTDKYTDLVRMAINSLKLARRYHKNWEEVVDQLWHENRNLYFDILQLNEYLSSLQKTGVVPPTHIAEIMQKNKNSYDKAYGISVDDPASEDQA